MKHILVILWLSFYTLPALAENTILIMGDSLSAAYGMDVQSGWVSLLKDRLKQHNLDYRVINSSISGDTTSNGLARLPKELAAYKPSVTIIELGGNDGMRGIPISTIQKNLQKMITLVQLSNSKVIIVGLRLPPNYGEQYTTEFKLIFHTLATLNKISLVPLFLNNVDENTHLFQSDRMHPTSEAQPIMLDNVWTVLAPLLH